MMLYTFISTGHAGQGGLGPEREAPRPWGLSLDSCLSQPRPQKPAGGCQQMSGKAEENISKRGQK